MNATSQPTEYRPRRTIEQVSEFLAEPVTAADFPKSMLRFRNNRAAQDVGLAQLSDLQWIEHFGRFTPLPDNLPEPLALRYHGHQFRVYNPEIGDGRGFLFAQLEDSDGRLMDLGTKGSGTTPYSRFGDGRLTLKGAVREVLATEMLEAQGVPTSRSFSVIETGEALHRGDEPSPARSAVLVRLNHGHIRIGSFQRLANLGKTEELMQLTAYVLRHYFGEEASEDGPARLLTLVAQKTAAMAASFMAAGFVHGVLNSDNINVTGESFDYGPWRWTPKFDGSFTAAYFDEAGLYAFGRQAEAIHWNVAQLAIALGQISDQDPLIEALNSFAPAYSEAIFDRMFWRLGIKRENSGQDKALMQSLESALSTQNHQIDQFFFDFQKSPDPEGYDDPASTIFKQERAKMTTWRGAVHPYWANSSPCSMHIEEVEAIWAPIAEADDWTAFENKVSAIREMGEALKG